MNIPIVFTHFGKSDFLELAINQAKFTNPNSEIYLLGDDANLYLKGFCNHQQFSKYSECDTVLKEAYKHFSTNSYEFEYFCFKRWFVLLDFMKNNNLNWICAADSDFMLYDNVSDYLTTILKRNNYTAAYCVQEQDFESFLWCGSGHISFVSKDFLESFCDFVISTYSSNFSLLQRKIDYHVKNNINGGICDMTLLYLYYIENKDDLFNLLVPFICVVFDNKIDYGTNFKVDEYHTKNDNFKAIEMIKGKPYVLSKENTIIQFVGLHFQGSAKSRMCDFYTGRKSNVFFKLKYNNIKKALKSKIKKALKI